MGTTPKPIDTGIVVGEVFLGKYRVDAILGHGGMGVVALCTHLQLQDRVAIKMLRPDVLNDEDAVSRFMREAQAASKLKSEYVAKVTDVGVFENNVPYMVMEYLDGQDLGQLLEERRQLPVPWATELILQASEALSEAHALGIVHRDVKPTNLFVTWRPDGSALVKVLDFGISKSPMGVEMQLTQTQSLLGTPAYMSPEQMRSARMVDLRTDIWSLGTVLYEAIEGRRPFEAESFSEMVVKVAVDPPIPMRNAPPALQPIILRCLAKTPEQRYANMAELGRDLLPFSQDPHGAQIMVERMERMVRRASGDWSDASTSGARVPNALREPAVRPTPLPQVRLPTPWAGGSEPAAPPWTGSTEVDARGSTPTIPQGPQSLQQAATIERPTIEHRPAEPTHRVTAQQPKRRSALLVVLLLAAAVGVAIGVAAALSGHEAPPARPAEAPPVPVAAPAPAPIAKPAPAPAPIAKPTLAPAPAPPPVPAVATDPAPGPELHPRPLPTPSPSPSPTPTPTIAKPRPEPAPVATPKPPPPTPTRPAADDCDPFVYPHGCPTATH